MKIRDEYTCPLELAHDLMKGKWKTIIVYQLRNGNASLSQLEHKIKGVTQKMLLQHLKELKLYGMIDKITFQGYPLHVEYFLTDRGKIMLESVKIMQKIGIQYMVEHGMTDALNRKGIHYEK